MIIKPPFDFGRQTDFAGIVRIYLPAVLRFDFQLHPDLPAVLNRGNFNRIARRLFAHRRIGAGGGTDGQVLVIHDMLGINKGFSPRFLRRYADLHTVMTDAVGRYVADVKSQDFPNEQEQY